MFSRSQSMILLLLGLLMLFVILPDFSLQNKGVTIMEPSGLANSTGQKLAPVRTVGQVGTNASRGCRTPHLLSDPRQHPTTALASFPGSGNTWLRYLIQLASGVLTGSQYFDLNLSKNGYPGEGWKDGRVAVVKTHEWGLKIRAKCLRAVLLIRSPGPAILAEFNRQGSADNHTGLASLDLFQKGNGSFWEKYVTAHLRDWEQLNLDWLKNFSGPLHVVQYEALRDALGPTLRDTLNFLDLPFDEEALQCTVVHSEGSFKRPPRLGQLDPYTPLMKQNLHFVQELVFREVHKRKSRTPYESTLSTLKKTLATFT